MVISAATLNAMVLGLLLFQLPRREKLNSTDHLGARMPSTAIVILAIESFSAWMIDVVVQMKRESLFVVDHD
jgi:hypothetical protein